ncbi:MAG TPA: HAMP domain-containing sensor histidine kinase, partial [Vicinamibacteria bacterium]|nr:HAMP domain-containing sensor histidine kinase [Vicinamibacteria bacterium]
YRHGRGQQVAISLEAGDAGFRVAVSDQGPGLSAQARARLFEPFHRGDGEVGGSGLGLAIARHLVEQHGGTLTVGDRPGGGCLAVLTVPAG